MAQKYAKGSRAWGICGRSGRKMLLKDMVFDGRYPNMRVDPEWYEDKHPQEYMPKVEDPTALWRPSPEVIAPPSSPVLTVLQASENTASVTWTPAETGITEIASYTIYRGVNGATPSVLVSCAVQRDFLGGITGVQHCTTTPSVPADDTSDQPQPGDGDGSVFDKVTNEDAPITYTDGGLVQGSTYCYYIVANPMGNNQSVAQGPPSAPSNTACLTMQVIQATAPVLSVQLDADGQRADLAWTASTVLGSTILHYELYRSDDGGSTFHLVHETDGVTLAYIDNPTPGQVYYWYVFAVPVLGQNSANSNTVNLPISNDPFYEDVVLLLHFDGNIVDSSIYAHPMVLTASGSVDTSDPPKFGSGTFLNPDAVTTGGSSCRLVTAYNQNDPIDILSGSEDFTIEGWVNLFSGTSTAQFPIVEIGGDQASFSGPGGSASAVIIRVARNGGGNAGSMSADTGIQQNGTGAGWGAVSTSGAGITIVPGTWYHFAVCRQNTLAHLFFDGNRVADGNSAWINYPFFNTAHYVTVGRTATVSGGQCPTRVDELRITKGIARYNAANSTYTIPTAPSFP